MTKADTTGETEVSEVQGNKANVESANKKAKTKQLEATHIPKKVYWTKKPNIYVDLPFIPEALDGLKPLFNPLLIPKDPK